MFDDNAEKQNVRVLESGLWNSGNEPGLDFKRVSGGLLVQDKDHGMISTAEVKVVTQRIPSEQELTDLLLAPAHFVFRPVQLVLPD
jgi:phosphoribosylaminoimidazolecarboxamide formyltransferase/IMP cyclohydrolase